MSNIKAPWCSTCGKDVHTIECEKCAQWWVALDLEKLEMKAEIERLTEEAKRIVSDEQYLISEWLIERASWLDKNSHGEDVLSISAELRWAADAIAAGEHLK